MGGFWWIAAVLVLLGLAFLLWPLLRRPADAFAAEAATLRKQLDTLELAERDGLIATDAAASRRAQLKAQLLELLERPRAAGAAGTAPAVPTMLVLAVGVPLLTVLLYRQFGTPHAFLFSGVANAASTAAAGGSGSPPAGQAMDLRAAAQALAQRLESRPGDVEGWSLLARTWQELGEFTQARDAYAHLYELAPDDADVLTDYAQALGLAANPRSLLGQPRELLERALKLKPAHQRAMWLYGFSLRQEGDLAGTLKVWDNLLTLLPPGSSEVVGLTEQINVVRTELGQAPLPTPSLVGTAPMQAPSAAPAAATPAASAPADPADQAPGLRVRVQLDPALAGKVAAGDVLYVFARAESGPPMPLAISRSSALQLPFEVHLNDSMAMTPALTLSTFPKVIVGARISKSGNAQASSGDLQGFSAAIEQPSSDVVQVLISDVVP